MITNALIALLDTGTPMHENVLPRGYVLPAICYHVFTHAPDYDLNGLSGTAVTKLQFDCYGRTAEEARQQAESIKSVLMSYTGTLSDGTEVQATFLDQDMAMPYLPNAATQPTHRVLLQIRVVHTI